MLTDSAVPLGDALRSAFDHMISEAEGELAEHEEHVADARRRLLNLQTLRRAMDAPSDLEIRP